MWTYDESKCTKVIHNIKILSKSVEAGKASNRCCPNFATVYEIHTMEFLLHKVALMRVWLSNINLFQLVKCTRAMIFMDVGTLSDVSPDGTCLPWCSLQRLVPCTRGRAKNWRAHYGISLKRGSTGNLAGEILFPSKAPRKVSLGIISAGPSQLSLRWGVIWQNCLDPILQSYENDW